MGRILHDAVKDGKEKESKKNYFLIHFFLAIVHALCYTSPILKRGGCPDNLKGRGAEPGQIRFLTKTLWIILT
jgi:hypothetical protein